MTTYSPRPHRWILVSMLFCLLLLQPAAAQSPTPDTTQTKPIVEILSRALGLAHKQVIAYQQTVGLGSLVYASHLAALSGQPLDALIARHAAGEGWGAIARSLGLHPGRSQANLGALVRAERAPGKPGHAGRPDAPGQSETAPGHANKPAKQPKK